MNVTGDDDESEWLGLRPEERSATLVIIMLLLLLHTILS